jgi:chitosanase
MIPKEKIKAIVSAFENGANTRGYSTVTVNKDGPGKIQMISFGIFQITEYGLLARLIFDYCQAQGQFSKQLHPYIPLIGKQSLVLDETFKNLLKEAGSDPVMQSVQDSFFDNNYWNPAQLWYDNHDFSLNLSMLVIFDSWINSGSIIWDIRNMFMTLTPDSGGIETDWIKNYVSARKLWMENKGGLVADDKNRMDTIQAIINNNDWDLIQPVKVLDNKGNTIIIIP